MSLLEYYTQRIAELTDEQRKHFPFAFGLIDAPSDAKEDEAYVAYWDLEQTIQNCKTELHKLKRLV